MTEDAQPERAELAALLEKHLSEAESPASRDTERVRLLHAYFDSLVGTPGAERPRLGANSGQSAPAEVVELASALVGHLPVDPAMGELLSTTYRRLGIFEGEVLSLAIELRDPTARRRDPIRQRLADLVQVEGREGVFRSLIGMADNGKKTDLLLHLQDSAIDAQAVGEFVSLADECSAALDPSSVEALRALKKAKARALGSDPADQGQAARAYKELIESFQREDDVRTFEAFVESRPSAEERHRERRWLYEWRAAKRSNRGEILASWARAEEEYGDPSAAIAVYRRLFEMDPTRKDALDALARLNLDAGDYEAALEPLRALRELSDETGRRAMSLGIARLLLEELGRPVEAAEALSPLLAVDPPLTGAREMAQRLIADPAAQSEVLERFEQLAHAADSLSSLRIFVFLAESREEGQSAEPRRRWLQRIVALSTTDAALAFPAIVKGAGEFPDARPLWDAAERIARELGKTDLISLAYYNALASGALQPALAETLGRRMATFEGECATDSSRLIDALQRVLELAPEARWALDRVKLVMGSQGRWDELFRLYDRAIDAARGDRERTELLEEAAFAAKDLAVDHARAIHYLELGHALRPDDASIHASLERLYERQGRTTDLIDLLSERVATSTGFELRQRRRRIADLWLDLGNAENALAVVEQGIDDDQASILDMVDVLERLIGSPTSGLVRERLSADARVASERAIVLLRSHYERAGRTGDVVRLAEASLSLAEDASGRARGIRDLVGVCLRDAQDATDPFTRVLRRIEAHVAESPGLAKVAYKLLLVRAMAARTRHSSTDDSVPRDAESVAWTAVARLTTLLLHQSERAAARRLLYRASRLPFEYGRRRQLLADAAIVASERLEDRDHAIRIFDELFSADAGDSAASKSLPKFAELLDGASQHAKLAELFEEQGRLRGASGLTAPQCEFWERAAQLWESAGAQSRAISAYGQSSALGSEASFEALARIYVKREQWANAAQALQWLCAHAMASNRSARAIRLSEAYTAIDERDRARGCLEEALAKADTANIDPVVKRLIALYRQDALWRPLGRLLASEARRTEDGQKRVAWLREAADLSRSQLSDPAEAAALLEEAIVNDPRDGALRPALADVLETLERWSDVAAALKGQIEWYGELRSKERAFTHQRRGAALIRAGEPHEALGEFRIAADMVAGEPSILHDLARVALELGQLELSESTYRVLLLALHQKAKARDPALPDRAAVFLDLSEIAARNDDAARAADLVDSAFDAAAEQGDDPIHLEESLGARGRYDLLARALERRVKRAPTLTARAVALGHLASVWSQRLGKSAELGPRIVEYAEAVGRDIDREDLTDAVAWTALSAIHSALGEQGAELGGRDRLAALLESAISKTGADPRRNGLRLTLAKMLLQPPARDEAAIAVLSSVHKDDPTLVEATELLASALDREGRLEDLVALLQERISGSAFRDDSAEFVNVSWRLGRALEELGRTQEALRAYETLVDRDCTDQETLRDLATRLEHLGSEHLAKCLELWMNAEPEHTSAIAEQLLALYDKEGDVAGAARVLEAGFAANPRNERFSARLVRMYEEKGQWGEAVRVLRRAADAEPAARALFPRLVAACQAGGDYSEGLRILDAAVARRPGDAELLTFRAILREGDGDGDGARSDLECAFSADTNSGPALIGLLERITAGAAASPAVDDHAIRLVDLLMSTGQTERAGKHLSALMERRPNHAAGLRRRAALSATDGHWDAAATAYRKLLSGMGRDNREEMARAASAMVEMYERAGHVEQAREPIERALEILPDSPELSRHLERLCEATGDFWRLAELLLARADHEGHAAEKVRLRLRAAGFLLEAGATSDAIAFIDHAREMDPENVDAAILQARAYVGTGRAREALLILGDAVELCQGKRTPLLSRVYLEIGKAHIAGDDLFEALDALDYACGVDRRSDEAAILLGLLAIDLGDEKTAERALSAITTMPSRKDFASIGPENSTKALAFYHLASLAFAKGDLGKARRLAGKAVGSGDPAHSAARALLDRLDVHGTLTGSTL